MSDDDRFEPGLADVVNAIWRRDPTIYAAPPALEPLLADRYGWLDVATRMRSQVPSLAAFRLATRRDRRTRAVLLGMGGSSLAADVMRQAFGSRPGGAELTILDSTHPRAVAAVLGANPPGISTYIVASKSGTTTEPRCFEQRFWHEAVSVLGDRAGDAFVAITDPGSHLASLAANHGYRRTFLNPPDIGGRYSALSYFGLVPAALAGHDVGAILDGAEEAMASCREAADLAANPGARLGQFLARHAAAGRDKLVLRCPAPFAAFGTWVEQLIAESLGKGGRGILPVEGAPFGDPAAWGGDRMIVAIDTGHDRARVLDGAGEQDPECAAHAATGTPVLRLSARDATDLGWLFFTWEFATAVAAALLGIEPFDQPDVERAKVETRRVLAGGAPSRSINLPEDPDPPGASEAVAAAIGSLAPTGYVAIHAYLPSDPPTDAALARLRARIGARTTSPVTTGYGPRFLHSTGQLHKGGIAGLCIQLVDRPAEGDPSVPGEWFGFGQLVAAQALGDAQALHSLGRPVIRIDVGTDPAVGIDQILADA